MCRRVVTGVCLALLIAGQAFADTIGLERVVTFDPGAGEIIRPGPRRGEVLEYHEAGMRVQTLGFHFHLDFGPRAVQFSDDSQGVRFSLVDGGTFSPLEILVGPPPGRLGDAIFRSSSGAVIIAGLGLLTFPEDGWTDITSFTWVLRPSPPGPVAGAVDNLRFRQIPEPALLVLLGGGGLAAAWRQRRLSVRSGRP